jgi:hypothetical protein
MNSAQAKAIPLPEYLARLSFLPAFARNGEAWYRSPFRPDERTPSFKIDLARNVWYDHGRGEGGTIIDLTASLYGGIGVSESLAHIADTVGGFGRGAGARRAGGAFPAVSTGSDAVGGVPVVREKPVIERVGTIADRRLEQYLQERAIPVDLARAYLSELEYRIGKSQFRALAFANDAGGYEVRSPTFKGSLGPKDIRYLAQEGRDDVAVFEGVYDFLSVLAAHRQDAPAGNVLVLNSVNLMARAVTELGNRAVSSLACYFDHDRAGALALATLRRELGAAVNVHDASGLYADFKDANAWWTAKALDGVA